MNQIALTGHISADPVLKKIASGKTVCVFSIADNDGSKASEHVTWFDCEAWERTADVISQYIRKGDQVSLYGRMRQETWKDESGQNRSKMKLVVSNVTLPKRTASRDEVLSQPVWDSTPVVKMEETEAPF